MYDKKRLPTLGLSLLERAALSPTKAKQSRGVFLHAHSVESESIRLLSVWIQYVYLGMFRETVSSQKKLVGSKDPFLQHKENIDAGIRFLACRTLVGSSGALRRGRPSRFLTTLAMVCLSRLPVGRRYLLEQLNKQARNEFEARQGELLLQTVSMDAWRKMGPGNHRNEILDVLARREQEALERLRGELPNIEEFVLETARHHLLDIFLRVAWSRYGSTFLVLVMTAAAVVVSLFAWHASSGAGIRRDLWEWIRFTIEWAIGVKV